MKKENRDREDYIKYLLDISDEDILDAMKEIEGYLDITLSDFKELYRFTCKHAVKRLVNFVKARDVMTKEVIFVKKVFI